jgi:cysteine desulfurase/selenocysteine lyase
MLDIKKEPISHPFTKVNGKPLVYFDNGATSQKPQVVIDAISKYYQEINANIHRGVHTLSQLATDAYEISRGKIQNHINAKFSHGVIYSWNHWN